MEKEFSYNKDNNYMDKQCKDGSNVSNEKNPIIPVSKNVSTRGFLPW